jgi:hypothetical protein
MNNDMGASFAKLLEETFLVYKGLRFERTSAGFVHNSILCRDFHDMDILVEQEEKSLDESINRLKK